MQDISKIVKQLLEERGNDLIKNPSLFCAMIDDLVPDYKKERNILRRVLIHNDKICVKLYELLSEGNCERKELIIFRDLLENDLGLSENWIDIVFDIFELPFVQNSKSNAETQKGIENVTEKKKIADNTLFNNFTEKRKNVDNMPFMDTYLNGEKIKYAGEMQSGVPHGYGKAVWDTSNIYEGDWSYGKKIGRGRYVWKNGDVYEGDFVDGKGTGKGRYTWKNGEVYEGGFVDGKRTGKGRYTWKNGEVYEGDFVDSKRTGKGRYTWKNGDVYEGDFVDGKRTGKGRYT